MTADLGRFGGLRYRQLVLQVSCTFLALRNPLKNFGLATMLKLLKILFKHRGLSFLNPCYGPCTKVATDRLCLYSIPYKDCEHVRISQTKRQFGTRSKRQQCKKQSFFVKTKTHLCRNMLAKPTLRFGGVIPKLSSLVYTVTSA